MDQTWSDKCQDKRGDYFPWTSAYIYARMNQYPTHTLGCWGDHQPQVLFRTHCRLSQGVFAEFLMLNMWIHSSWITFVQHNKNMTHPVNTKTTWREQSFFLMSSAQAAPPCPQDGCVPQKALGCWGFLGWRLLHLNLSVLLLFPPCFCDHSTARSSCSLLSRLPDRWLLYNKDLG